MGTLRIGMIDGLKNKTFKTFGVLDAATADEAGAIVDAWALLTDCGVNYGNVTKTTKLKPNFTPTNATAGSRTWRVGRATVAVSKVDGGSQSFATIDIPGLKAAFENASGQMIDNTGTFLDGDLKNFFDLFLTAGKGRLSDGQFVTNSNIVSGYVFEDAHPTSAN